MADLPIGKIVYIESTDSHGEELKEKHPFLIIRQATRDEFIKYHESEEWTIERLMETKSYYARNYYEVSTD